MERKGATAIGSKMYLYRAVFGKNGDSDPTSVYLYARNKKAAKAFCKNYFGSFDHFEATKFGETSVYPESGDAGFVEEEGEKALISANIAANGEIYAERTTGGG